MATTHPGIWLARRGRYGVLLAGVSWLAVAYLAASLAIDRGNPWEYLAAAFFLVWGVRYVIYFGRTFAGGRQQAKRP